MIHLSLAQRRTEGDHVSFAGYRHHKCPIFNQQRYGRGVHFGSVPARPRPWLFAGMPLPTGNSVGLAGRSHSAEGWTSHGHYVSSVALRQAFPIRDPAPVGAGFHPGQPSVSQLRHPHPALGHDRLSRYSSHAEQQRRVQRSKALGRGPTCGPHRASCLRDYGTEGRDRADAAPRSVDLSGEHETSELSPREPTSQCRTRKQAKP